MASVNESLGNQSQLNAAQRAGIEAIDRNQTITFTKYIRLVLPLDGFVFWVRADQVSAAALANASALNSVALNTPLTVVTPAPTIVVQGSLHYSTDVVMEEGEAYDKNTVIFTAESDIDPFNEVGPEVMYIGEFMGVRFSFSRRAPLYIQAGIYHYSGVAIVPAMLSQIIDDVTTFDASNIIVSNSLPIWMGLNQFMPMYPSFLSTQNIAPPYATVHISETSGLQSAPLIDAQSNHYQLAKDRVKVTIYGLRNFSALDFLDYVNQFTLDSGVMGIMNIPVPRDEKRTQTELGTIAMKKIIEFDVNYYQTVSRNLARQLINSAIPAVLGD